MTEPRRQSQRLENYKLERLERRVSGVSSSSSAALAAHIADSNPHPGYLTPAEGDAAYAPVSHVGAGGAAHSLVVASGAAGFMSGADKAKLDAISGTNTGDQTSIVGITGTLAQFNAALTGADFATGGGTATGTNTGDQTLAGLGGQPLDATLTALAAANWAANAMPIGSGADTLSQVAFAANTFPARASAGNLVAKTITDYALTLLDDSTAAAARVTLGASEGLYTPVGTTVANCTAVSSPDSCMWTQQGDLVTVYGNLSVTVTAAALTQFSITLPVASNLQSASNDDCVGTGTAGSGASQPSCFVRSDTVNDRAFFQFTSAAGGVTPVRFTFRYRVRS